MQKSHTRAVQVSFLKMKGKISPLRNSNIPRSLSTSIAKGTINSRCYNEKQMHRKYWRRDGTQVLNCTCNPGERMAFIILSFQITLQSKWLNGFAAKETINDTRLSQIMMKRTGDFTKKKNKELTETCVTVLIINHNMNLPCLFLPIIIKGTRYCSDQSF